MRTMIISAIALLSIFVSSCNNNTEETTKSNDTTITQDILSDGIHVMYFHGQRQCPSCIAIGEETNKLLASDYSEQTNAGKIVFLEINVDDDQNKAIVEKYEIAGSALLIIKVVSGKEEITDLTGDGFKLARNMPDMFKEKLKVAIDSFLK